MARIELECTACGSKVVTTDVTEMLAWNKEHDSKCPGQKPKAYEPPTADELADCDDDEGCEGHESLDGAHMGETVYCDGSCRPVRSR